MLEALCHGKTAAGNSAGLVDTAAVDYIVAPGQNLQFRESLRSSRDHHIPQVDSIPQTDCTLGLQKLLEDGQRQLCIRCLCLL